MNEDPVGEALDALLVALREEVTAEDKVSYTEHCKLQADYAKLYDEHVELEREFNGLTTRIDGMVRKLTRIRTKADMASGYTNASGGFDEADLQGRAAGAEGAVDRLIALYAGKLKEEQGD